MAADVVFGLQQAGAADFVFGYQRPYESGAVRTVAIFSEAQMALIETGMVKTEEVFLPYAVVGANGKSLSMFEWMESKKFLALGGFVRQLGKNTKLSFNSSDRSRFHCRVGGCIATSPFY